MKNNLLLFFLLISVVFVLSSCKDSSTEHTHDFTVKSTEEKYIATSADCENAATYYYSCACGLHNTDTFTYGEPKEHAFTEKNTDSKYYASEANCKSGDAYYFSCACGARGTELFAIGEPTGEHTESEWITDIEVTLDRDGKRHIECIFCHTVLEEETLYSDDFIYWTDKQTLIIEINTNSNNGDLSDACQRYLAGEGNYSIDYGALDTLVAQRNAAAETAANVDIKYSFPIIDATGGKGYGQNRAHFWNTLDYSDSRRPDIFINYLYDVLVATLSGSFINLYTNTELSKTTSGEGQNYFSFAKDPNVYDTGEGYMYEYMRSLTVSRNTMYIIASDYFIDTVRAMLVVPVNNDELATMIASDRTGDRVFDIDDLYQLVRDREWTFDTLATLCDIYDRDMDGIAGIRQSHTLKDKVGFAVSVSSPLSASGILYSQPIEIIGREYHDVYPTDAPYYEDFKQSAINNWRDFVYDYPESSGDLLEFTAALESLFNTEGVITVQDGAVDGADCFDTQNGDSLVGIVNAFADGNVLFGGTVLLGSLESDVYSRMTEGDKTGIGILPVPLYKKPNVIGEYGYEFDYATQIHNLARVGAVSRATKKFEACSAFLEYQSTHSSDVIEEYFTDKIQRSLANGSEGALEMLGLIRGNVRTALEKAMDDLAQAAFESHYTGYGEPDFYYWYSIIQGGDFRATEEMLEVYEEWITKKVEFLAAVQVLYIEHSAR